MLQALKEEPPLNTKCKDKFLIQSTVITPEKETMSLADIVRIAVLSLLRPQINQTVKYSGLAQI